MAQQHDLQELVFKSWSEPSGAVFPVLPQWCLRVDGRKFFQYLALAKKRPRRSIVYLPTLDPLSRAATVWGTISTITDLTYTSFVVPLSLAFNNYLQNPVYNVLDFIGGGIYLFDMFFQFHVGFMIRWQQETVTITDGIEIAKKYIRKGTFVIDFLAVLPLFVQIVMVSAGSFTSQAVQLILLIKLLRLLRVINMLKRMGKVDEGGILFDYIASRASALTLFAIHTVLSLLILVNLLACLWWWSAVVQGINNSWAAYMTKPNIDLETANNATRWLVSAYYILCTIATIGYGDIVPQTVLEVALAVCFIIIGVIYFGYILTSIGSVMQTSNASTAQGNALLEKMQRMEQWMKQNGFPKSLRMEVRKFYFNNWIPHDAVEESFFEELPTWLRVKAFKTVFEKSPTRAALVGADASLTHAENTTLLNVLSSTVIPLRFTAGHRIFKSGDVSAHMYLLEEGEVVFALPSRNKPLRLSAPSVIGMGALFADDVPLCMQHPLSLYCATNCMVWKVDAEALRRQLFVLAPGVLLMILRQYKKQLSRAKEFLSRDDSKNNESVKHLAKIYLESIEGLASHEVHLERIAAEAEPPLEFVSGASGPLSTPGDEDEENQNGEKDKSSSRRLFNTIFNRKQANLAAEESGSALGHDGGVGFAG